MRRCEAGGCEEQATVLLSAEIRGRTIYWDPLNVARRRGLSLCHAHALATPVPPGWVRCDRMGSRPQFRFSHDDTDADDDAGAHDTGSPTPPPPSETAPPLPDSDLLLEILTAARAPADTPRPTGPLLSRALLGEPRHDGRAPSTGP